MKDGNVGHITREPEQVKAFRDTWRDGIHSYLTYMRDRLTVARDLLSDSGSIFIQIGDENVHLLRSLLDEVFGTRNYIGQILFTKTSGFTTTFMPQIGDYLLWYAKDRSHTKYREPLRAKRLGEEGTTQFVNVEDEDGRLKRLQESEVIGGYFVGSGALLAIGDASSQGAASSPEPVELWGVNRFPPSGRHWTVGTSGMERLRYAGRTHLIGNSVMVKRYFTDWPMLPVTNLWSDTVMTGFTESKTYVVQTSVNVIQRCILMTTDPGDLVLDPTCGSGTTATVSEQWGRRWITIDTSRVALALARARIMGARYPFYLLADSREGQLKEAEVTNSTPSSQPVHGNICYGFVYERVPHITLKSIANNSEIDVIWKKWQSKMEPIRESLNVTLKKTWQEWEIPRDVDKINWSEAGKILHGEWWQARNNRQKEIDQSIVAKAEFVFLYDKPYENRKKVRVAGPFTVESISPHRTLGVDENDELIDPLKQKVGVGETQKGFIQMILENLKLSGVQQAHKDDKIDFTALIPWPGDLICAEGRYMEGDAEKRAAIFVGAEFGTAQRVDLVAAAREAGDAGFDVLIACAFNYEAHATEFNKLGRIPVLKARMNADLHMADDLKNTGKGNLFVIFGEPDIDILPAKDNKFKVKINGVDVFHPNTGEVRSDGADGIACWFIDTDYNEESFFVRHAYFLGANDPYSSLKTTLKAEINKDAWDSLHSDTSRPFPKPTSGRIAVKVINHLGDEVMKVFKIN